MLVFSYTRCSQDTSGTADCLRQDTGTTSWYAINSGYVEYCSVCDKAPADSRSRDWLCRHCAELQRMLPRRLRHNLAVMRQALDDFDKILRRARSAWRPPPWFWRQYSTAPQRPVRPALAAPRPRRAQVRVPKIRSQQALRLLRAGHLRPR